MRKVDIEGIIEARLRDAEVLFGASRFDGSIYLCGYAVELGLKARICTILQWDEYPTGGKYSTFKTHDFDVLLHLTGLEREIKLNYMADWSIVAEWRPEARYKPIGKTTQSEAQGMIESTKEILTRL